MPSRLALPKRILWLVCLWLLCLAAPMQAQGSIITGDQLTRIEQLGADNQTIVLAYDSQGNLIEKQSGAQTTSYQWDANDRLTSVSQDGTLLGQYRNNAQGLRVEKQASDPLHPGAPPQKTTWLWDQDTPIQESNAAATVVARYEFAGREPIGLLHAQDGAQSLHPDGLGSIVLTTDTGGNIHRETIFDAWGNTIAESGPPANRLGYTGHQMDQESGLIYMQARYYDPQIGRFLSMDPADGSIETPASYHRYLYAYGNPTVYIDLDGQESVSTMIDNGAERCGPLGCMGWALLKGVYTVATLGFSTVHDPVHDAYDEGRVSGKQYVGYGIGGGLAVVGVNAVTGRVGGTLMARAGAPLIAKAAVGAATGAVSGAINDAGTQAAHIGAGIQQEYDTTRTLDAMKTGAIVGGLVPVGAQAVVSTEATVKQALASRAAARLETATGQSTQVTRAAAQRETPTAAISAGNRTITQESASTAGVTAAPATRATVAAETGVANGGRAVVQISNAAKGGMETTTAIGRVKDLQNLCPGEKSLLDRLPNQGSPKANWQQNSGVLREEMRLGNPIRDASPGNTAGQFLNAERNLLMDRGWTFDPKTNYWMPPKP